MNLLLTDKTLHEIRTTDVYTCIDLSQMKISSCMGCFGCWIKTPGKCVIRDDAISVYPLIAQADSVIYVTRNEQYLYNRHSSEFTIMKHIMFNVPYYLKKRLLSHMVVLTQRNTIHSVRL